MSKIAVSSAQKPKAHYKIVFSPGTNLNQGLKGVKLGRSQGAGARVNDLEAAINSITYQNDSDVFESSGNTTKEIRKGNMVTLNSSQLDGQKLEKIVFLPKYVQKKVTVIRDTPKKIGGTLGGVNRTGLTIPKPKVFRVPGYTPIKKTEQESSGLMFKKRKLGDMALETWNTPIKTENIEHDPSSLCRVCGSMIEESVIDLVDQTGVLTKMGTKLKTIVGTDINDSPLYPPACCKSCSFKVNVCFTLLTELQASDEVVRTTYADLEEGDLVNPGTHIYTCQYCQQEVVGMKAFINHYETHISSKTIGPPSSVNLDNAIEDEPEDDPMLTAQVFLEEDTDDGTITFQNDLGEFVCEVCGRTFKYIFLLQLHRKAPKRGPAQEALPSSKVCFVCKEPRASTVTSDLPCKQCRDAEIIESSKVECEVCHKKMLPTSLHPHMLKHNAEKRFFCDMCSAGFTYKYALKHHLKYHDKPETLFYTSSSCHICLQELMSMPQLRQHLLSEHDIRWQPGWNNFSCQQCSKPFDDLFKLRLHMRLYHNIELPVRLRTPGLRRFECHVCKQVFNSENAARIHMRVEHNLTNNQMESLKQACEECGKMFSVRQNLINHINSAHLKVKPMSCDVCGERFGKHSSLIFHKLRHTGEKPFQCALCSKSYRQRNDVMRHLARHVRDKELEYEKAYAINNSTSKFLSKRYVYLKDSTIKGLLDMAMCTASPRKKNSKNKQSKEATSFYEMKNDSYANESTGEVYEEIVLPEGAVLVDENGENAGIQYVVAENGNYVVQEEMSGDVSYIVENVKEETGEEQEQYVLADDESPYLGSPKEGQYVLQENEAGEQFWVRVEEIAVGETVET